MGEQQSVPSVRGEVASQFLTPRYQTALVDGDAQQDKALSQVDRVRKAAMKLKLLIFLLIVVVFVTFLVYFERTRQQPWDSDVFFGQTAPQPTTDVIERHSDA